ncbi:MAG: hypothetical protein ACN6ON_05705, partial [Sphingobacterium sp.]
MKKIITLLYTAVILLMFSSCSEDFLDKPPLTAIDNEKYWKTANDLENYTIQFYSVFPAFNTVGSYMGAIGWDGTRGSDVQISSSPSTVWNGTESPVSSGGNWTWGNIRSVNIFFKNYTKCKDPFEKYKQFLGEAH